jgi:hypothetical protein
VPSLQVTPGTRYRFATKYNGGNADELRAWLMQSFAFQDVSVFMPRSQLPSDWPADDAWRDSGMPTFRVEATWTRPPQVLPIPQTDIVLWSREIPVVAKPGPSPVLLWGAAGVMIMLAGGLGLYVYKARRKAR